ncbi:hypothetical protein ACQ4LE_010841 [Meloidogyne hapla]
MDMDLLDVNMMEHQRSTTTAVSARQLYKGSCAIKDVQYDDVCVAGFGLSLQRPTIGHKLVRQQNADLL